MVARVAAAVVVGAVRSAFIDISATMPLPKSTVLSFISAVARMLAGWTKASSPTLISNFSPFNKFSLGVSFSSSFEQETNVCEAEIRTITLSKWYIFLTMFFISLNFYCFINDGSSIFPTFFCGSCRTVTGWSVTDIAAVFHLDKCAARRHITFRFDYLLHFKCW